MYKRQEMDPIIKVFFGSSVKVGAASLGTPWEYFEKELANADNTEISLRPVSYTHLFYCLIKKWK